jgi:hypothetical protein
MWRLDSMLPNTEKYRRHVDVFDTVGCSTVVRMSPAKAM